MSEPCPSCGAAVSGRFCDQCGVAISAACRECGNPLPKGARFCNMCGAPVAAQPAAAVPARTPVVPWAVAGVAVLGLIIVLLVPRRSAGPEPQPAGPVAAAPFAPAGGAGDPSKVDLSQMTPREAADRLFNRVMTAVSSGDSAQAQQFVPMAIMAYQRVDSLDADGRYHLAALQLVAGDYASAKAQADTILAASPTHLFGLFTAAEAESRAGHASAAKSLYRKFVDSYDSEMAKKLPEYQEHAQGLPAMREQAISAAK